MYDKNQSEYVHSYACLPTERGLAIAIFQVRLSSVVAAVVPMYYTALNVLALLVVPSTDCCMQPFSPNRLYYKAMLLMELARPYLGFMLEANAVVTWLRPWRRFVIPIYYIIYMSFYRIEKYSTDVMRYFAARF